jgi:molybdopterin converting factor small subunit
MSNRKYFYVYYSYEPWGRGYIGKRECECLPEEDVKYFGSYRDKTFKPTEKIVLEIFSTLQEVMQAEILLHEFYQVDKNPHFANRAKATSTAFYYVAKGEDNPFYGRTHTEDSKNKISESLKALGENHPSKTEEFRENNRKFMQERMKSYGENMENHPSKKPEVREKISESLKDLGENHPSKQPEHKKKNSECRKGEKNHFYGKKHTEESKELVKSKNKGRKQDRSIVERRTKTALKYKYLFISPDNQRYEIDNANEFCIDNGLNSSGAYQVARGNWSNHQGWKVVRISKNLDFTEEIIQEHLKKLEWVDRTNGEKMIGRKDTEETKQKKSIALKGKKKSKGSIEKRTDSFCKYIWTFISPEGIVYESYNCNELCRELNLCQVGMGRVARGDRPHYKGWKISRRPRNKDDK